MRHSFRGNSGFYRVVAGVFAVGVMIVLVSPAARVFLLERYEDVSFALDPSAARAYQYGEWHFSEAVAGAYDLQRAHTFLAYAAEKDPTLPYVYHELARIAFLNGNFTQAIALINIQIANQGDKTPNSYYIKGLIEGYMGRYEDSIADYERYLQFVPNNWAGMNDCAWVMLKADKPAEAAKLVERGLSAFPDNPWLLSTYATALYRTGDIAGAKVAIEKASTAVAGLTDAEWSHAYPGNDPNIAPEGVAAFKAAVEANRTLIEASSTAR